MRTRLSPLLPIVVAVAALGAQGAQSDQDPQQPTFRAGVNVVRVDVTATDRRGTPITDLTRDDFEILENGTPQAIEQFRLVDVDGNPGAGDPAPRIIRSADDEALEASRDDVRIFAILLADYQVCWERQDLVREVLARFVRTRLGPNDLVAVMGPLTPVNAFRFTYDHEQIVREIRRFEARKGDYSPRNAVEGEHWLQANQHSLSQPEFIANMEAIRDQVVRDALKALAFRVGSMREGRKAILFVSEGFSASLGTGRLDSREIGLDFREIARDANRQNASIYPLDPRGFVAGLRGAGGSVRPGCPRGASQDTLRDLADDTDGRAIVNTNDLDQGLAQMVRDSSVYYLLGYNSTESQYDGKYHEITVRVKRPNVDVRARKGYWASTEADAIRAANPAPDVPRPVLEALASMAAPVQDGSYVRTWVGTARGDNGQTRVTLVWEPLAGRSDPRAAQPGGASLIAAGANGSLVFRSPAAAATAADAATRRFVFDAPPGTVELRLTVEEEGGGTLDREVRSIDVPDLTAPEAALSTPRVYRARTALELRGYAADPDAVPVAAREFARTERLLIRFDAYGAGSERPSPSASVLNRAGEHMFDVPVVPASAGGTHQIDLGLGSMPNGEYLLQIALAEDNAARQLVAFRLR